MQLILLFITAFATHDNFFEHKLNFLSCDANSVSHVDVVQNACLQLDYLAF